MAKKVERSSKGKQKDPAQPDQTTSEKKAAKDKKLSATLAIPELQKEDFVTFGGPLKNPNQKRAKTEAIPEMQKEGISGDLHQMFSESDAMRDTIAQGPAFQVRQSFGKLILGATIGVLLLALIYLVFS